MTGFFRPRGLVAATIVIAAWFAAPAMAAEAQAPLAAQTASIAGLTFPVGMTMVQPTSAVAQPLPAVATRPLHDLVIAFVDYGNQDEEQACLAKAVYFEARGETLEGQLAVAEVVLNRAASGLYPATICGVVTQHAQFSFIQSGHFPAVDASSECWHKALAIADVARKHLAREIAPNVLWYHASYVAPAWGRVKTRVAQIGAHIFYS
jgi:spore germination cell wall hydrolase CwlJ-like protein